MSAFSTPGVKHFPFILGTDITKLSRWEIGENPLRIISIAHKILHGEDFEGLKRAKPEVYKALDPLGVRGLPVVKWSSGPADYKKQLSQTIASSSYLGLLTPTTRKSTQQYLAGRFAVKEAARKAWGPTNVGFRDLWVGFQYPTQVFCMLMEGTTPARGQASLSHDGDYCVATVMAEPLSIAMDGSRDQRKASKQATRMNDSMTTVISSNKEEH